MSNSSGLDEQPNAKAQLMNALMGSQNGTRLQLLANLVQNQEVMDAQSFHVPPEDVQSFHASAEDPPAYEITQIETAVNSQFSQNGPQNDTISLLNARISSGNLPTQSESFSQGQVDQLKLELMEMQERLKNAEERHATELKTSQLDAEAQISKMRAELSRQTTTFNDKIKELEKKCAEKDREYQSLASRPKDHSKAYSKTHISIDTSTTSINSSIMSINSSKKTRASKDSMQVKKLELEVNSLKAQLQDASRISDKQQALNNTLKQELKEVRRQLENASKVSPMETNEMELNKTLNSELKRKDKQLKEAKADAESSKAQLDAIINELNDAKMTIQDMGAELMAVKNELEKAKEDCEVKDAELKHYSETIEVLKAQKNHWLNQKMPKDRFTLIRENDRYEILVKAEQERAKSFAKERDRLQKVVHEYRVTSEKFERTNKELLKNMQEIQNGPDFLKYRKEIKSKDARIKQLQEEKEKQLRNHHKSECQLIRKNTELKTKIAGLERRIQAMGGVVRNPRYA